jgi:hypothetical protein
LAPTPLADTIVHSMWTLEPPSRPAALASGAAHLAAMALLVWFQELGQRLRREEQRAWWAGTGRDLLNAAGFAAIAAALYGGGFPGPAATLLGATETLLVFGIYTYVSTRTGLAHPRAWSIAAGVLVCVPALAWPSHVVEGLGSLATALFPAAR